MTSKLHAALRAATGRRMVCFDFDGTVTVRDVGAGLVERFAPRGWEEHEERWKRGDISSAECMRAQFGLMTATRSEIDAFIDAVPVDASFDALVKALRASGFDAMILSDGLDYYIERILARTSSASLTVVANRTVFQPDGRLDLVPPFPAELRDEAGNHKAHVVGTLLRAYDHVTLIGDGLSDRGAARVADLVFAKKDLLQHCRRHALNHEPFEHLGDLMPGGA